MNYPMETMFDEVREESLDLTRRTQWWCTQGS